MPCERMNVAVRVESYWEVVHEGETRMLRMRSDRDLASFEWFPIKASPLANSSFALNSFSVASKRRVLCQASTSAPHTLSCLLELLDQRNRRAGGVVCQQEQAFFLAFIQYSWLITSLSRNLTYFPDGQSSDARSPILPHTNNTSLYTIL
jgi:hypothetical protein